MSLIQSATQVIYFQSLEVDNPGEYIVQNVGPLLELQAQQDVMSHAPRDLKIYDLTSADVAKQFGVLPKTVLRWVSLPDSDPQHLPAVKLGPRLVFSQRDVDDRKQRLLKPSPSR